MTAVIVVNCTLSASVIVRRMAWRITSPSVSSSYHFPVTGRSSMRRLYVATSLASA